MFASTAEGVALAGASIFFCIYSIEYAGLATLYTFDPGHGRCSLLLFERINFKGFKLTASLAKTLDRVLKVEGLSVAQLDISN